MRRRGSDAIALNAFIAVFLIRKLSLYCPLSKSIGLSGHLLTLWEGVWDEEESLRGGCRLPRCGGVSDPRLVLSVSMPFGLVYIEYDLEAALMSPVFPIRLGGRHRLRHPDLSLAVSIQPGRWWMPVVAGLIIGVPLLLALAGQPTLGECADLRAADCTLRTRLLAGLAVGRRTKRVC